MDLNVCVVNCGNWEFGEGCLVVNWGYWLDIFKIVFVYIVVYKFRDGFIYIVNMLLVYVK